MADNRNGALAAASAREPRRVCVEEGPISSYFGRNVFAFEAMRKYISPAAFSAVRKARETGAKIGRELADDIASGMKTWALEHGATHYTHLFQPLTGATAEKHEAFISVRKDGPAIELFDGGALVQQEPDASSFPNGGLRNTFEARGYTSWDPNSPVFILDGTLCIPSVFVSYTGEALDMKVPNLKSIRAINQAATKVASLFDENVKSVSIQVGLEQEYFLVDEALYNARPDLQQCGRTVIGHTAAKDQQLSDHYFGIIPQRVEAFMKDFETEAYKLGIPLKTRHNEVAPNQFECAPVYGDITGAVDQNMLLMILMQKVAKRHRLKVLFHEKPFAGINGSGKHCNWSLRTDTGVNLFSPGKTPGKNLRFLAFYSCVLKALSEHQYLLMASVCSLDNYYRLGGSEAPPRILSVFSGSALSKVLESIIKKEDVQETGDSLNSLDSMPEIIPDNTDRNRTSPFAFTGNRFEFRALGASANPASATFVLNAIVADSLEKFYARVRELEESGDESAIMTAIREFLTDSKNVMFEGNGYDGSWREEAARRGLRAVDNPVVAFQAFEEESSVDVLTRTGVLSKEEINARVEVLEDTYVKKLQIEARVQGDICQNHIIPAAISYQNILAKNLHYAKELFPSDYEEKSSAAMQLYTRISSYINSLAADVHELVEARKKANHCTDIKQKAMLYSTEVLSCMEKVRDSADNLEMLVSDELWPMPKYRELLYL